MKCGLLRADISKVRDELADLSLVLERNASQKLGCLTATKEIRGRLRTLRVQTISTLADGVTPDAREAMNAARIRAHFPGDRLLLIPKRR